MSDNDEYKKMLKRAIDELKQNFRAGEMIPKKDIPRIFIKSGIDNLWVYDLNKEFRLIYTLINMPNNEVGIDNIRVISLLLEHNTHKHYERLFKRK